MSLSGTATEEAKFIDLIKRYYSDENIEPNPSNEILTSVLTQVNAIQDYAHSTFPHLTLLSEEDLVILSQSIFVPHQSPEKSIVDTDRNYIETKRTLSRFYCIQLLMQGESGYDAFVAHQERHSRFLPTLTKEQYLVLAQKYKIDALTLDTLKLATLISSVPLSKEARKRADNILGKDNYVVDSVEFPARIFEDIDLARQVYPQVNFFLEKYPNQEDQTKIIELLQSAFSHHRHYRHMLYTEGSHAMFKALVEDRNAGRLSKAAFDFWILYWTTNITGFQGNVNPKGSYYLTSNTFNAMSALESVLQTPSLTAQQIYQFYLLQRASFLKLNDITNVGYSLDVNEQTFLAHIGAMMRLHDPIHGQLLAAAYLIFKNAISQMQTDFLKPDESMPTPTYAPALFGNVRDALKKRYSNEKVFQASSRILAKGLNTTANEHKDMLAIVETLVICVPLYLMAMQKYKAMREQKDIPSNVPLNFQTIASPEWLLDLFDRSVLLDRIHILELIDINVSVEGRVSYQKKPNYDEILAWQIKQSQNPEWDPLAPSSSYTPGYSTALTASSSSVLAPPVTTALSLR